MKKKPKVIQGITPAEQAQVKAQEAALESKPALSRVLLQQGHDRLNLAGNFANDSFNSLADEATGVLTMVTVYRDFDDTLFWAAFSILMVNIFIRIVLALYTIILPAPGTQLARGSGWTTWLRLVDGFLLMMVEPVAGIRLLGSAYEPSPPMTPVQREELMDAKLKALNVAVEAAAKAAEANQKAAAAQAAEKKVAELPESNRAVARGMSSATMQEVEAVKLEIEYLEMQAPLVQEESDFKVLIAEFELLERKFSIERKRLAGTETVEVMMAVFEDFPELVVGFVFVAKGGLAQASPADVSLFITSIGISIFHALKCVWSFWKLRSIIKQAKLADSKLLNTYNDYFVPRELKVRGGADDGIARFAARRKELEPARVKAEAARLAVEAEFKRLEGEAAQLTDNTALLADLARRKQEGGDAKAALAAEQERQAELAGVVQVTLDMSNGRALGLKMNKNPATGKGATIKAVDAGGQAEASGKFKLGQIVTNINGTDVTEMTMKEIAPIIKSSDTVKFTLMTGTHLSLVGLRQKTRSMTKDNIAGEFKSLPNRLVPVSKLPQGAKVFTRNLRYIPWPQTAVKVNMKENSSGTSFINASYVRGPNNEPKKYIVTQAPQSGRHAAQGKGHTIDTLWSMIYDQRCPAVVMIEGSQPYVPQGQPGTKDEHHNLIVTLMNVEKKSTWVVTTVEVSHKGGRGAPKHIVKHFNFLGWPRDGVPTSTAPIMQMMCDVMEITDKRSGPLVVQDLCGTGKAGTYIAIEHAFQACDEKGHADIAQIVQTLREDRAGMVMTPDEYAFIHKVVTMYSLELLTTELSSEEAAHTRHGTCKFDGCTTNAIAGFKHCYRHGGGC